MKQVSFPEALHGAAPIVLDGGLATRLEQQGCRLHETLWSAALLLSDPEAIVLAHRAYLDAGAQCIISASYQATRSGLMTLGVTAGEADTLIIRSVELARIARDRYRAAHPESTQPIYVAASIGPYGAARQDGSEYAGAYGVDDAALREFHEYRLSLLDAGGADVLACETIPDHREAAVLAALLESARTPAWISFSCRDGAHLNNGTPLREAAAPFRDHPGVLAVGVNCTPPQFVTSLIAELRACAPDKAVVVYPNSGERYEAADNTWHGTATPLEWGRAATDWRRAGATVIGGCCRVGPEHIRSMREQL